VSYQHFFFIHITRFPRFEIFFVSPESRVFVSRVGICKSHALITLVRYILLPRYLLFCDIGKMCIFVSVIEKKIYSENEV